MTDRVYCVLKHFLSIVRDWNLATIWQTLFALRCRRVHLPFIVMGSIYKQARSTPVTRFCVIKFLLAILYEKLYISTELDLAQF